MITRRAFQHIALVLTPLAYAGGIAAAAIKFLGPVPGRRGKSRQEVCPLESLEEGKAPELVEFNRKAIYVLREKGEVLAINAKCTHVGCGVSWEESQGCFVCPCHAARFDRSGNVTKPPASRPLGRQKVVVEDGIVVLVEDPAAGAS